jgi:hypothetical protein
MKQIVIKIPTKPEFKKWWEILKFKLLGGFVCDGCGVRMFFDAIELDVMVCGKKLIFNTHNKNKLCPHCVQKEIANNAKIVFTESHRCDWCGAEKPTVTFFNLHHHDNIKTNFTFGSSWWNGHYICETCLSQGLDHGVDKMKSSISVFDEKTKKMLYKNRLGLLKPADKTP